MNLIYHIRIHIYIREIIGLDISKIKYKNIIKFASVKKILTVWIFAPLISFFLSFMLTILPKYFGVL